MEVDINLIEDIIPVEEDIILEEVDKIPITKDIILMEAIRVDITLKELDITLMELDIILIMEDNFKREDRILTMEEDITLRVEGRILIMVDMILIVVVDMMLTTVGDTNRNSIAEDIKMVDISLMEVDMLEEEDRMGIKEVGDMLPKEEVGN